MAYSNPEAGDAFVLTLGDDTVSDDLVVGLPVGDHHHHLGCSWTAAAGLLKAPLTAGQKAH